MQYKTAAWLVAPILACSLTLAACGSSDNGSAPLDDDPVPATSAEASLTFHSVKTFRFSWTDVSDANHYKLLENPDGISGFTQVGSDVLQGVERIDHIVPLYARTNAQYILQSCTDGGCIDSDVLSVSGRLEESIGTVRIDNTNEGDWFSRSVSLSADGNTLAVGTFTTPQMSGPVWSGAVYVFTRNDSEWTQQAYLTASNTDAPVWEGDEFGGSISLSADGKTLAVGAQMEDSNATGVNGNQNDNTADQAGAVYVFVRTGSDWSQQAYIKASNAERDDWFGHSVSLNADGNTLAVGAWLEDSDATGINGDQSDNSEGQSGAVYVFTRNGSEWSQQAYLKASNSGESDYFGWSISLSEDGNTLAVGSDQESSSATGINGNQSDNSAAHSGAVYVFIRNGDTWSQQAYIKASNTGAIVYFAYSISLSADGNTLAVGAIQESSSATGINGNQSDNSAARSGAVYVFIRNGDTWSQQAYIKASNTGTNDNFGHSVSLSADGNTLAVGAPSEDSNAIGINADQNDNSASGLYGAAGAAYVFTRTVGEWSQLAYVKTKNAFAFDVFGSSVSLAGNGNTLAVRASGGSNSLNGDQIDNNTEDYSDVVYLY